MFIFIDIFILCIFLNNDFIIGMPFDITYGSGPVKGYESQDLLLVGELHGKILRLLYMYVCFCIYDCLYMYVCVYLRMSMSVCMCVLQ